jgi:hypothetical protein
MTWVISREQQKKKEEEKYPCLTEDPRWRWRSRDLTEIAAAIPPGADEIQDNDRSHGNGYCSIIHSIFNDVSQTMPKACRHNGGRKGSKEGVRETVRIMYLLDPPDNVNFGSGSKTGVRLSGHHRGHQHVPEPWVAVDNSAVNMSRMRSKERKNAVQCQRCRPRVFAPTERWTGTFKVLGKSRIYEISD